MRIKVQSSILLHISNLSLNFTWIPAYRSRSLDLLETRPRSLLAASVLTKILKSLPPISDPLVPTSGTFSISPCHIDYLYLHILAYQCNPGAPCRTYVMTAAGLILLFSLTLLRLLSLQRREETTQIRKLDREPSYPIVFHGLNQGQCFFESHRNAHGGVVRTGKELMGIARLEG